LATNTGFSGYPSTRLNAILLPRVQRRIIKVRADIGASSALVLGPHHLYMIGSETQDLYEASNPALTDTR
jgi:hypothetical protein